MSLPAIDPSLWTFAGGAIGVAFLGSWHCAGMCGPIAALAARPRTVALYQIGRLTSYVSLGALAALFGEQVLGWIPEDKKWMVAVILGALSFWVLLSSWNLELPRKLQRALWKLRPQGSETANFLSLGVVTGLLPCHWLYGFLLVAAGLGDSFKGMILLFALWVGSLPWLLGSSSVGGLLRRWAAKSPWAARIILATVVVGLMAHGFMSADEHLGCKLSVGSLTELN